MTWVLPGSFNTAPENRPSQKEALSRLPVPSFFIGKHSLWKNFGGCNWRACLGEMSCEAIGNLDASAREFSWCFDGDLKKHNNSPLIEELINWLIVWLTDLFLSDLLIELDYTTVKY